MLCQYYLLFWLNWLPIYIYRTIFVIMSRELPLFHTGCFQKSSFSLMGLLTPHQSVQEIPVVNNLSVSRILSSLQFWSFSTYLWSVDGIREHKNLNAIESYVRWENIIIIMINLLTMRQLIKLEKIKEWYEVIDSWKHGIVF